MPTLFDVLNVLLLLLLSAETTSPLVTRRLTSSDDEVTASYGRKLRANFDGRRTIKSLSLYNIIWYTENESSVDFGLSLSYYGKEASKEGPDNQARSNNVKDGKKQGHVEACHFISGACPFIEWHGT